MTETRIEKIVLLTLAGLCIASLTLIAVLALRSKSVDANAATLIGVIAAGLIAFGKDIVQAIRSYAMSAQLGKVTDQLAASQPITDAPQDVTVVNTPDNAVPTDPQETK